MVGRYTARVLNVQEFLDDRVLTGCCLREEEDMIEIAVAVGNTWAYTKSVPSYEILH